VETLARQLIFTAKAMRRCFEARLAEVGASLPIWVVLRALHLEPGLHQRELATRLHIEGPTLTRHLDRLEAHGLVVRRRDAADRRALRIEMTPSGETMYLKLVDIARRTEQQGLRGIAARERALLRHLLGRIYDNLEELDADATA
jgi:MarR family transcriptional regulator, transcriptional regulator for hemolysin